MTPNPPEPGDFITDLTARPPRVREVLGRTVHEGQLVKIWYRLTSNQIRALFPGQFKLLKRKAKP